MTDSALSFFLPRLDGSAFAGLQLLFALVFLAAAIAIPVLLRRAAQPAQWEQRLAAIEGADATTPTYHTAEELSQAVATAAERWADMLPGLLLVFGLLGTFIGIGLALSDAAGVLGGSQDPAAGLTSIMDALGSKFKISTWGILAYLFLRVWAIVHPYEAARLAWSARLIRTRAADAGQRQAQHAADERKQLLDVMTQLLAVQQAEAQRAHVRHADLMGALRPDVR